MTEYNPIVAVDIPNKPQPQGSMTSFGRGRMTYPRHVLEHREYVTGMLAAAYKGEPVTGPVVVWLVGFLPRPKSHFGTGRNASKLKPSAPAVPATKPDLDKLARLVGDSLTNAGVLRDDAQIVTWHAHKRYASVAPFTRITVDHYEGDDE